MSKIIILGSIKNNVLEYVDKNYFKTVYDEFLRVNNDKKVEISIKTIDSVKYYIHKYYRGYLLPDIASAMGEIDQDYVHHVVLKKMFLLRKCDGFNDIPKKYLSRCRFVEHNNEIIGYIPSMADLTNDEAKEYILKCENMLFVELEGHIAMSEKNYIEKQVEAKNYRDGIYG